MPHDTQKRIEKLEKELKHLKDNVEDEPVPEDAATDPQGNIIPDDPIPGVVIGSGTEGDIVVEPEGERPVVICEDNITAGTPTDEDRAKVRVTGSNPTGSTWFGTIVELEKISNEKKADMLDTLVDMVPDLDRGDLTTTENRTGSVASDLKRSGVRKVRDYIADLQSEVRRTENRNVDTPGDTDE